MAIRSQPETGEAVRRYAERALGLRAGEPIDLPIESYQTLGLLTTAEAERIAGLTGIEAMRREFYDWSIDRYAPIPIRNEHGNEAREAKRGQRAVKPQDYSRLAEMLLSPDAMSIDADMLIIEKTLDGERFAAAFRVQAERRMLALVSIVDTPARGPALNARSVRCMRPQRDARADVRSVSTTEDVGIGGRQYHDTAPQPGLRAFGNLRPVR